MKIGPHNNPPVAPAAGDRKSTPAPAAVAPVAASAEPSTQVALSPAATTRSGASTDATFDTAKVDRIAQAIRDGHFQVHPEAIADKLIANASELLGRKTS